MPEISEYGPDLYTLVDEEGKEQTFELLDVMEVEDQVYYALVPYAEKPEDILEGSDELVVLKMEEVDGEEFFCFHFYNLTICLLMCLSCYGKNSRPVCRKCKPGGCVHSLVVILFQVFLYSFLPPSSAVLS